LFFDNNGQLLNPLRKKRSPPPQFISYAERLVHARKIQEEREEEEREMEEEERERMEEFKRLLAGYGESDDEEDGNDAKSSGETDKKEES